MRTLLGMMAAAATVAAPTPALKPQLSGLDFLVGRWATPTRGAVADTGGSSIGEIDFTPAAGGAALLRRDHVRLFDRAGKPAGGFDIVMMIYAEGGAIHADYADGDHVIHYTSARVEPGRSVTFDTAASATAPAFRLSYVLTKPGVIDIAFQATAPGGAPFRPIATGSATKAR